MSKFIALVIGIFLLCACQPKLNDHWITTADSLRISLHPQKELLMSFPLDSLAWSSEKIKEHEMQLQMLMDSTGMASYQSYFQMQQKIQNIIDWHGAMLTLVAKDEKRLNDLKITLTQHLDSDAKGNEINEAYLNETFLKETQHADSVQKAVLEQFAKSIQAIQMVKWMSPLLNNEVATLKEKKE